MDIFTTGAHLRPIWTTDTSGKRMLVWLVIEFVDNSFRDGEIFNPPEVGYSIEELTVNETPMDEED